MKTLKCRAEILPDVILARRMLGKRAMNWRVHLNEEVGDVEATFDVDFRMSVEQVRALLRKEPPNDLHVMRQSLDTFDRYTGRRDSSVV
jgi:hypothetical protein